MKNLVIVESPAKAKIINKYLGKDYFVMATVGHVRELPAKQGRVDPSNNFEMHWETLSSRKEVISNLTKAVKECDRILLATDPDREGEAIAWHVQQILNKKNIRNDLEYQRIVFHEITPSAIQQAIKSPRSIDENLVDSYLARRALDYLVGFTLSPVLWRKLPGSRSAGRVQSVALRLICDRENEINVFKNQEYWSVTASLEKDKNILLTNLKRFNNKNLTRLSISDEKEAKNIQKSLQASNPWELFEIDKKTITRHPSPPFTTSTLQQEASRKLGFSTSKTMMIAQKLYEGITVGGELSGLISYMRTDSPTISQDAIKSIRNMISSDYGKQYLPDQQQNYKSKSKNAQEAHEAVRPTQMNITPKDLKDVDPDAAKLYSLIWKRALASQMKSCKIDRTTYNFKDVDNQHTLRANGSVVLFDGFTCLYTEGTDDTNESKNKENNSAIIDSKILPDLAKGTKLQLTNVDLQQHFTQPPPRFNEASLVKKLEELGIGRPSTYSSIMRVIRERDYVIMDNKRFIPSSKGRLLTGFLDFYFKKYVADDFTAEVEEELDKIANNQLSRLSLLETFWAPFNETCTNVTSLKNRDVLDVLDKLMEPVLFPDANSENIDKIRRCSVCKEGRMTLKSGKFGGFLGCERYPDCKNIIQIEKDGLNKKSEIESSLPKVLGTDPTTGLEISLRSGPYGLYVQKEAKGDKEKPRRASLAKDIDPERIDFDEVVKLLSLPRLIGSHPDTGKDITSQIGRFGPYVKHESNFASIPKDETPWSIGLNRAVILLVESANKFSRRKFTKKKATRKPAKK